MTTANIQIKKILVGRGNTAVASTYDGVRGEIVLDTGLNTLRVYDGTITGGTVLATNQQVLTLANLVSNSAIRVGSTPPATSTTGTLWYDSEGGRTYIRYANTWVDASPSVTNRSIVDITANVAQLQGILEELGQELGVAFGTIQGNIDTLTSDAQTLTNSFNAYKTYANANAATITTTAQTLSSNLGRYQTYANLNINTLLYEDARLSANLGAYQTYANANARALAYQVKSLDANVGRILLYENSTGSGANVTVDTTPPVVNSTGSLWWDTEDGRLYLRYNDTWVDASPTTLDLGKFIFDFNEDRAFINTTNDAGGRDGYDIVLSPGGEGYSSITIPRSANAANAAPLVIGANDPNSAVQISTDAGTWTFGNTGTLTIPDSSTIRTQNWGSFSLKSDNADIVIMTDVDNSRGWTFGNTGSLTVPGKITTPSVIGTGAVSANLYIGAGTATGCSATGGSTIIQGGHGDIGTGGSGPVQIQTGSDTGNPDFKYTWTFDDQGRLLLPNAYSSGGTLMSADGFSFYNTNTFQYPRLDTANIIVPPNGSTDSIQVNNNNGNVQLSSNTNTWMFSTDGNLAFPNNSAFDGQTLTDHATGANYTLKIANGGVAGSVFGIGTGSAAYGIANDALNHTQDGYVPYSVTASRINLTVLGAGSWVFDNTGNLTLPAGGDIRDSVSNISVLKTRIGDTYSTQFFQQLTIAHDEGKLITINHDGLFRLPQITANLLGAEFEFYFSADAGQVYIQAFYTDNRATTDRFVGSVFVGVDNDVTGRLHTATAGVPDANYLFLGQHHAKSGSYIRFKAIAFDGVGTWLVQGQCVGDSVNTTPNGHSYIFQNYYD
jgi:hypothetical protein